MKDLSLPCNRSNLFSTDLSCLRQQIHVPIQIRDLLLPWAGWSTLPGLARHVVVAPVRRRSRVGAGEHYLHMTECDRPVVDIQELVREDIVEVRRDKDFGATGATMEEVLQYPAEEAGAICTDVRGRDGTGKGLWVRTCRECALAELVEDDKRASGTVSYRQGDLV